MKSVFYKGCYFLKGPFCLTSETRGDVYVLIYCMTKFSEKENFEAYAKGKKKEKHFVPMGQLKRWQNLKQEYKIRIQTCL